MTSQLIAAEKLISILNDECKYQLNKLRTDDPDFVRWVAICYQVNYYLARSKTGEWN